MPPDIQVPSAYSTDHPPIPTYSTDYGYPSGSKGVLRILLSDYKSTFWPLVSADAASSSSSHVGQTLSLFLFHTYQCIFVKFNCAGEVRLLPRLMTSSPLDCRIRYLL